MSRTEAPWFEEKALLSLRKKENEQTASGAPFAPEVRWAVARLFARHFLTHLKAELRKPETIEQWDYDKLPAREATEAICAKVRDEFSIAEDEPLPDQNLIKIWIGLEGGHDYESLSFVGFGHLFLCRLLDLRDGTPESFGRLVGTMRRVFGKIDYEGRHLPVSLFLHLENLMRELMRQMAREYLPQFQPEADHLVVLQGLAYQRDMYEYFEGVIVETLAENVRLLHGILPAEVVTELKRHGSVAPHCVPDAAVLFTDFEHFSAAAEHLTPTEIVGRLDTYFSAFDLIMTKHGLEKIKTIGDSYMAVAGVPQAHLDPVCAACEAALEILSEAERISGPEGWKIRIGLHVGPIVAGVIGKQKFSYDVWGATVNFASRMESSGAPGRINASAAFQFRASRQYCWEPRGAQPVKGLGVAEMYFLLAKNHAVTGRS